MKTKERILQLAISLIQERGDLGWSYEDISAEVGIRKASIHYHFPRKEDLIIEAARVYIARGIQEVEGALKKAGNFREKVFAVSNCYRRVFCLKDKLCLCVTLTQNAVAKDPALFEMIKSFFDTVHRVLASILEEKRIGEPKKMATAILAMLQGLLILGEYGWTEQDFDASLEQVLQRL